PGRSHSYEGLDTLASAHYSTSGSESGPGAGAGEAGVEGVAVGELHDAGAQDVDVRSGLERRGDDVRDLRELLVAESAGRERRGPDAHARRGHRRSRVERNRVAVHGDADGVQDVLGVLPVDRRVSKVDE